MATRIASDQIQNLQQIEAAVAGPGGANRLFTIAGQFTVGAGVFLLAGGGNQNQSTGMFTVLIGPKFTRQQFFRAIGSAWLAKTSANVETAPPFGFAWAISSVDADWDDESGQVELRIEVFMQVRGGAFNLVEIGSLAFQVTILAAVAT